MKHFKMSWFGIMLFLCGCDLLSQIESNSYAENSSEATESARLFINDTVFSHQPVEIAVKSIKKNDLASERTAQAFMARPSKFFTTEKAITGNSNNKHISPEEVNPFEYAANREKKFLQGASKELDKRPPEPNWKTPGFNTIYELEREMMKEPEWVRKLREEK